jgi:putative endonuclease
MGLMGFSYVYILQSVNSRDRFYVGHTEDLHDRLKRHNAGEVPHTSRHRPWRIKTAMAFTDPAQAVHFERYLKSSSGRAFAKKRL